MRALESGSQHPPTHFAPAPRLRSWVDVDTRGYVAPIAGYSALPNTVYYRIPTTPQAADVARIRSDVNSTFPTDPPFSCVKG